MLLLADWLLRHSVVMCLLLHSLVLMTFCFHHAATSCSKNCYCSESSGGLKTVRCSNKRLTEIPQDIPNDTHHLYLDFNLITVVPTNAFLELPLLSELDLSHNEIAKLEPGAFRGLSSSLEFLDLSSNKLMTLQPEAFESLRARTNLSNNPWHCDCALHTQLPKLELQPKTTDVAMLVTMFGWFTMVISYLVYYVRQNQEDARRHLEYLKSLPSRQRKSEESSTISTVV
ncbi:LRC3B protein, partial [Amia calva]|nr:LRC3B protein [Amia calva]